MTETPDDTLLPLARSIADGESVSWELEKTSDPEVRRRLERLRRLADIVDAQRRVAGESPATGSTAAKSDIAFRWGPLEVHERIGEGAFGEVYRAVEPRLSREVALKLRREADSGSTPRELLDEARRLARVRHPNVLVVHGADVHDGRVGIWTELVHGNTLDQRLEARGPCSAAEVIQLGLDLSRALAAVHAAGLLHGDIKGANVLRATDGRTLLADFGSGSTALTTERATFSSGSPLFMAPELLAGQPPTAATEVYALGALLYRQASAKDPITANTLEALADAHRMGARTPLLDARPDVPSALADVIDRMLHPNPNERLATAADVESALLAAAREPSTDSGGRASDTAPPHNIPVPVTSFVGRRRELRRVAELMSTSPLITIHGAGGTGKTRLALEIGRETLAEYPDGVWMVDLAPIASADHVAQTVASTLHAPSGADITRRLIDFLSYRSLLLILDNCEHVIDGCVCLVDALLPSCARLRILTTSREPLNVHGEVSCPISSLDVPGDELRDPESIARTDAAVLFAERARTAAPGFAIDTATARPVADICCRLDGIPLAIELAAALLTSMSLDEVQTALEKRHALLTTGTRAARPRHRTLAALIDWSFEMLPPEPQMLLRRLSSFAGGWTLEAAERVCVGNDLAAADVLSLIEETQRKSLVEVDPRRGTKRYRLLEPVREYLAERLEGEERDRVREQHRDYFLAFAERAAPHVEGSDQLDWLARMEDEHNNLRAALDASEEPTCDTDIGHRLAGALGRFWEVRGHWNEALRRIDTVFARAGTEQSALLARVLCVAGNLARFTGETARARAYCERSQVMSRAIDNATCEANASNGLGIVALQEGELDRAEAHLRHALALNTATGERDQRCAFLVTLGVTLDRLGKSESAVAVIEEALEIARETRNIYRLSICLDNYGNALDEVGRLEEAEVAYREALDLLRELGDRRALSVCANNLGILLYKTGRRDEATEFMEESLRTKYRIGNRLGIAYSLETFLAQAEVEGDHERVVALAEAAREIRDAIKEPSPDQPNIDRAVSTARQALGDERFEACRREARKLQLGEAVELALANS